MPCEVESRPQFSVCFGSISVGSLTKLYIVDTQKNRLDETVLLSANNVWICRET